MGTVKVPTNLWTAAILLAHEVKRHKEVMMDKFSEPWNIHILEALTNFQERMDKEGDLIEYESSESD